MSCSGGGDGVSHHVECNLPTCALRSWHLCVNARGKCEVCREDAKQGTGHRLTSKEGNTSRSRLCNWKAIPHIICTRKEGWEMLSIIEFNQDVFRKKTHRTPYFPGNIVRFCPMYNWKVVRLMFLQSRLSSFILGAALMANIGEGGKKKEHGPASNCLQMWSNCVWHISQLIHSQRRF